MREWWASGLPGALSLRAFGVAVPLVLLTAVLLSEGSSDASALAWFFFALAAFVAVAIVAHIAGRWASGRSASVRRGITIALLALAGPLTIAGALLVNILAGLPSPSDVNADLIALSALLAVWVLTGGRLSSSLDEDARHREELLREVSREKALALESARLVDVDRRRLTQEVRNLVTDRLIATHGDGGDPDDAAAHLRSLIDEAVRPLSHELHDAQIREEELVDQVATMRIPKPPALLAKPGQVATAELGDVLLAAALVGASVMAGFVAWISNAGALWVWIPVVYSSALAVVFLLASVRVTRTREEATEAFQAADRASALVRQTAWVTRRRLANTMHGEVQGRILASALRLPHMSPEQEAEELGALADDLRHILDTELADGDWRVAWDRLMEMWSYSIDLSVDGLETLGAQLAGDSVAGTALVAVLNEAVTNAVRHGGAQHIRVTMNPCEEGAFDVVVVDDGNAGKAMGMPSLGSNTLDAVCLTWKLESLSAGHRLAARIPVRATQAPGSRRENSEYSAVHVQ